MHRFMALRYSPTAPPPPLVAEALARLGSDFERIVETWGFTLCWQSQGRDAAPLILPRALGAIFGTLFSRGGERMTQRDANEVWAFEVARSGGVKLVSEYWGDYIAFLRVPARGSVHAVRDPSGGRALLVTERCGVWIMCSHAEDLVRGFGPVRPNAAYVRGFLRNAFVATQATGLDGVEEAAPGVALSFEKGAPAERALWRPGTLSHEPLLRFDEARAAIRQTVDLCVGAWGRSSGRVLHRLSGGLDSSIVLSSLRRNASDAEIVCATERARGAQESDERRHAKAVAAAFSTELIELEVSAEQARLERLFEAPLAARPNLSLISYANPLFATTLEAHAACLVTSGEGGDQLFQRSPGPYGAADAWRARRGVREVLDAALDAAHLTGDSVWSVLGFALCRGRLARPFDVRGTALLTPHHAASAGDYVESDHAWLEDCANTPPGKAMQIWRLIDVLSHAAPVEATEHVQYPIVLGSQPIVETCLKIAPHLFVAGGEDRALWRAAFADALPESCLKRQGKGGATRYFVSMLDRRRPFLAERLLEGQLVREGMVDRERIDAILRAPLWTSAQKHNLLSLLCSEAWLSRLAVLNAEASSQRAASSCA